MALEISGKLIKKLDVQSGQSDRGSWSRQEIIIEVPGQFPRQVCLSLWNEQVNEAARFNIGDILKVGVDIQSREYNGKWYTSIRPWRMEVEAVGVATPPPAASAPAAPAAPATAGVTAGEDPFNTTQSQEDDLPF
ncbi:MAG: DUF3127 domain-containing protein [Prevotellaceae bacterium]|jgi:hypothetical protein|nr:DUF3127 domain-containing protein [Prevotellaceae bacterium]